MGTELIKPSAKPSPSPFADPEMLENLDLLNNFELIRHQADWEAIEAIPPKVYEDPRSAQGLGADVAPSPPGDGKKK